MNNLAFSNLELKKFCDENKGVLHQYNDCIIEVISGEDYDFNWHIERLYISNSIFDLLDGIDFEDAEDAIEDGKQLINYLLLNLDKFKDNEEFILIGIDEKSNFVMFKDYLEKSKSNYHNYLSWKLRKKIKS